MNSDNTEAHLNDLLKDFSTAMLVTAHSEGHLHARPMSIAELEPDSSMYFATQKGSPKVFAISANSTVLITLQSSSEYVSLTGTASIVSDRAMIDRLWSEAWKVWFPAGKDDPNLILIRFDPKTAEYWDNSGAEGVKYLFEGLKAYVQGRQPSVDPSINAKVNLRR